MHMTKKPGIGLGRHLASASSSADTSDSFRSPAGSDSDESCLALRVVVRCQAAPVSTVFRLYYSPTVMKIQSTLNSVHVQNANHMSLMVISSLRLILLIQRAQLCLFFPPSTSRTPQTSKGAWLSANTTCPRRDWPPELCP